MLNRRLLYLTRARKLQKEKLLLAKNQKKADDQIKKDKLKKWLDSKDVKYNSQLGLKKLIILKKDTQERFSTEEAESDAKKKDDPSEDRVSTTASAQE